MVTRKLLLKSCSYSKVQPKIFIHKYEKASENCIGVSYYNAILLSSMGGINPLSDNVIIYPQKRPFDVTRRTQLEFPAGLGASDWRKSAKQI